MKNLLTSMIYSPFSSLICICDFFALCSSKLFRSKGQTLSLILNILQVKPWIDWINYEGIMYVENGMAIKVNSINQQQLNWDSINQISSRMIW